jgi:hypothetical protein
MTSDPWQGLDPETLTPDCQRLLSLALDAYLVGYTQVAQDLTSLASRLNEPEGSARFGEIARLIITRADEPDQAFETLLKPFNMTELLGESVTSRSTKPHSPSS